jgi:hypothetical protein
MAGMPQSMSTLDGPPPSPQLGGGGPTGAPSPFSLSDMAGGPQGTPSNAMPPEILTGVMQAAQQIGALVDSFAQVTPDLAMDWAGLKEHLAEILAKLVQSGSGPTSPTATGPAFPGGGMDRGIAGPGTV